MAKLGFLGLGIMGYPMARNLRRKGHELWVWSHTRAKAERLASEEGAVACGSPKEVAAQVECVFVCVGDTEMSRGVILGPGGVIEGAEAGLVVVDCSTISPLVSAEINRQLEAKGVEMLDAPVTGSKAGAESGTLTFMVGGKREIFERVRPYLEAMGTQFFYCGGPGMGLRVKVVQNLIQANILQAFNEGMVLAVKAGVDPNLLLEVINNTGARSNLVVAKGPNVLRRDFSTHFSTKWMYKDLGLALELAAHVRVPIPGTALTHQIFQAALAKGWSEEDYSSTIKVLEEIAGVVVQG